MPATVSVLPELAARPLLAAFKVTPRLAANVNVLVPSSVPPLSVSEAAVVEPGIAPRLLSALTDKMPPLMVVFPP
jgi:hypothetical protein